MATPGNQTDMEPPAATDIHQAEDEYTKVDQREEIVHMPEELRNMTDAEIADMKKKMVRKMDAVIMPIIGVLYILNYIDRQALGATKVYGIMDDLDMSLSDFATAISILFVGYIPFQIPSNMIMTKVTRPGLYICSAALVWGVVSTCTAAVKTFEQLLVVRVFLGVTEAVFFPGVIYYLSAWYDKNELGKRLALLYVFQMVGNAFGGLIAAACLTLDGQHGIAGWRWLFIVEGVITIGCGLIFALIMPEYPHKARLLKPIERQYAVWRLEMEAGAGEANEETSTLKSFQQAFMDPKIWTLVWCMGMSQAMGSTNNFFPSIVETLGYNKMNTMLLTAPPAVLAAIASYLVSWYSDRRNAMYPIICASLGVAVAAYIIPLATINTAGRYVAMMMMPSVVAVPQIMIYKTMNLHMARPYPKRAAGVAMINSIGGLSNIWASYLYYDAPRYVAAFGGVLGCTAAFFITITLYGLYVRRLNKRLAGTREEQERVMKGGVTQQQVDLGWRYIGY